jgi:hypothetical protein
VFDAEHGRVGVSPERAAVHNRLLDEALLKGLVEDRQVDRAGA